MTTASSQSGSRTELLSPDQRAVLSLLLRQRRRYAQIADMLSISESAVHDRAHAALAVLAPALARRLDAAEREQVGEYLLSQQDAGAARATRALLARSPEARAWAQSLAGELMALGPAELPEIPSGAPDGAARGPATTGAGGAVSKRGGALLLAGLAAAACVALIIALTSGGKGASSQNQPASARTTTTSTATSAAAGQPRIESQLNLVPPEPGSSALGVVEIVSDKGRRAFYLAAEHLPPTHGFFYAVWLYDSQSRAKALGRAPSVGSDGRLQTAELLPAGAASYQRIVLTRETSPNPKEPGPIVLQGTLSLH